MTMATVEINLFNYMDFLPASTPEREPVCKPTPLMKQYEEMKKKHPDAVLLFRVGDFYETFGEDAVLASDILGITLTRLPMAGTKYIKPFRPVFPSIPRPRRRTTP